ncbi:lipoprotein-releasing ABC transporter permease subunit [Alteromonas halophila]|uniref:Transporter n=1 Tax=Alteromonas halophila TaxID=516698 RepID=A0A918MVE8_9ALTE|nr:lipoprotein-releasing ABC transporter permease subunit [Alteromonas halophila]GGW76484.1 transporter [Alteromonas halophila]
MFQPTSAFIALRYATAGKHNSFVAFINRFSVAGIALGLAALIVIVSVMNGFESQLKQRVLGVVPHIVASTPPDQIRQQAIPGLRAAMAYREAEGVVQSRRGLRGIQLQGIETAQMREHAMVTQTVEAGQFSHIEPGSFVVAIGRALAVQLEIRVGDRLRVLIADASVYTPFGRMPSQRLVTVGAIFDMRSQMDDKVIYLHEDDLRRLLRKPESEQPATRLFLNDAFNYQQAMAVLEDNKIEAISWRSRQGPLFDAVKMEKNMMFLMLVLIIAVAAFNIVSALVMVVSEKQGDIAILQTQGMHLSGIRWVFICNGVFNGVKGALIGLVLGLVLTTQLNPLLSVLNVPLALSADGRGVPVVLQIDQVVLVTTLSLVLCLLASLYPAMRATRIAPAVALQND